MWLGDCPPEQLRLMPEAMKRVQAVKKFRLASKSLPTQKLSEKPTRFHVENMPLSNYLIIPETSSERRAIVPIGFERPETLCSNAVKIVTDATLFHFGVLTSIMHMAWMRAIFGSLKSDFRYSAGIVYNNFPWPTLPVRGELVELQQAVNASTGSARAVKNIEAAAQALLDARAVHINASLADLYDPLTMPANLLKAHQALDEAVDAAYGYKGAVTDAARVAFLFERYQQITSLLPAFVTKTKKVTKKPRN